MYSTANLIFFIVEASGSLRSVFLSFLVALCNAILVTVQLFDFPTCWSAAQ